MIIDILIKNKRYTFLTLMESLSAREVCDRQKYLYLLDIAWKKKKLIQYIISEKTMYVYLISIVQNFMRCIARVNRSSATSYCKQSDRKMFKHIIAYGFAKIFVFYDVQLLSKLLYLLNAYSIEEN